MTQLHTRPRLGLSRPRRGRADAAWLWAFGALVVLLVVAPLLLPAGERDVVGTPFQAPFDGTLLGTDSQGRDVFSRVVLGMRTSLGAAVVIVLAGAVVGAIVGTIAALAGGWIDTVLMRLTDAGLAMPGTLIALAVAAALGPGLENTVIAVAVTWWPWYARILRGEVRRIRASAWVEAARQSRASRVQQVLVHVLPGTLGTVVVAASLDLGAVVLTLSGLSFLGLGSPSPAAELGAMTNQGLTYLFNAPWIACAPAAAVFVLAMLSNFAGDAARDRVAP